MGLTGDLKDAHGQFLTEDVELWKRDPVEVIREIIGNPVFKDGMKYAPYRIHEGQHQAWDEAASGERWWELQVFVVKNLAIRPLIAE
jgi:hypothetical protein